MHFYALSFATLLVGTSCAFAQQARRMPTPVVQALRPRQTQSLGTPLYLDEPSCDSYQCNTTFYPGDTATAHWLDAPAGNVVLQLVQHPHENFKPVATVPGVTSGCDTEGQKTCGQFRWIVPSAWAPGNYTLQASSENDASITSYTDIILVQVNSSNTTNVPFTALDPVASNSTTASTSAGSSASSSSGASGTSTAGSASGSTGSSTSQGSQSSSSSAPASSSASGGSTAATMNGAVRGIDMKWAPLGSRTVLGFVGLASLIVLVAV